MAQQLNRSQKIVRTKKFKDVLSCLLTRNSPLKPTCSGCDSEWMCYNIRIAVR